MFKPGTITEYFCDDCGQQLAGWREGAQVAEVSIDNKTALVRFLHKDSSCSAGVYKGGEAVFCDGCMAKNMTKLKEAI